MLTVTESTFRGRAAFLVSTPLLHAVVLRCGGHLAALFSPTDASQTSPLWQPHWPAGDPSTAAAAGTWGAGANAVEAPLLASICGSNLCVDRFGAPRDGETRPLHGEAGVVDWRLSSATDARVVFSATLPLARLDVTRSLSFRGSTLVLETEVRADASGGVRPLIEWAEHTTLGNAFLDGCVITAGVDVAAAMPDNGAVDVEMMPVADVLAVPSAADPPTGSVRTCRVVDGWWEATNAALGWRLRARWDRAGFPWLCVWTEHRLRTHAPWGGVERARGMEISTKPFPEGAPPKERDSEFLGSPSAPIALAEGATAARTVELTWERI